jgi:two-component system sensor histidine kinase/response regulator
MGPLEGTHAKVGRRALRHARTLPFKLSLLVVLVLVVFGLAVGTVGIDQFSRVMREEAIKNGRAVASTLSSSLVEIIATQQNAAVSSAIRSAKKTAGLAYVEVVEPDGTLIAHTYDGEPPRRDVKKRREAVQIQDDTVAGREVIDIPAEVITGAIVHVGLDRSAIEQKLGRARWAILGLTVVEVLLALLAMFWAARPFVRDLAETNRELRETDERLRVAVEASEQASRAKSQFLANVSHEVRTPLNAVIGMTSLALKTELTAKQAGYIGKAQASARLLLELINDILDLSKIEAGKLELQSVPFVLDDVLGDIAGIVGFRAVEKGLEVLFAPSSRVPRVLEGDPLRLGQVLLNLVNNAIKFTEKGEIVVGVDLVEKDADRVTLKFEVKDTGIGIDQAFMPALFDPFTQADASTTRQYGGTGLGLAISRRLVELMGGEIHAESGRGRGSVFTFTARFGASAREPAPAPRQQLHGLPVLVVDDNETARAVFQEMLASFNMEVTCVASGEIALAQVERAARRGAPYRLVLADWRMPGMDGIETLKRIRQADWLAVQPGLILATAYGREEVVQLAQQAGVDVFVNKPVSPSTLLNAVMQALSGREPKADLVAKSQAPSSVRFAAGAHVLLVEDNPLNREVARELLSAAGVRVTEATNGAEALRLIEERPFHAVLMDVQMPEMDGIEATRRIREDTRARDLPVIAMTAHAMAGDRERFLSAGMNDYVAKPIEESELLGVLARWVPLEGGSAAARREAAPLSTLPGLDSATAIRRIGGREDLYRRLLVTFRAQAPGLIAELSGAADRKEREAVRKLAHGLKGVAATIGADEVASSAARLEQAADENDGSEALLGELEKALARVLEGLDRIEDRPAGGRDAGKRAAAG